MSIIEYIPAYSPEQWAGIAAFIAVVAAIGTFLQVVIAWYGLAFVGRQIRDARRTSDVQNLLNFYKSITDAEKAFISPEDAEQKDHAFYELANLLEVQAMALRGCLYTGVTREAVKLKLLDTCALIKLSPEWFLKLEDGRSTDSGLKDLFLFIRKNRRKIRKIERRIQSQTSPDVLSNTSENSTACSNRIQLSTNRQSTKREVSLWWNF